MEPEFVLTGITLTMALSDTAIAYFGIYKPFRAEKRKGHVSSFGEYWSNGLKNFSETLSYSWSD